MTKSFATVAAAALMLAAPVSTAFAQGIDAPVVQARSLFGVPSWVFENEDARADADDTTTTGSAAPRRAYRGVDSSAKGGNAAQQDRVVPQYGNTAGGPAE